MIDPSPSRICADAFDILPAKDWPAYREAIEALRVAGIGVAVGGGLAFGCYAHCPRYTKDMDLFLRPDDRERAVAAVREAGFEDYYEREAYQRHWIFRGYRNGLILDLIWQMANDRAAVDEEWLSRGPAVAIHGTRLRLVPVEEIVWGKLYVFQRERCDWPDLFNLFACCGPQLDWPRLIARTGSDRPLLSAAVQIFAWLDAERAAALPPFIWHELGLIGPEPRDANVRAALFDTRDWYHPVAGPAR